MGSSGGGGGAGKTDWPDYMKNRHEAWLGEVDVLMGTASNPYASVVAYDPDPNITAMDTAIGIYAADLLAGGAEYYIAALVNNVADAFYDHLYYYVLPGIGAAVYSANLVQSSAYAIAQMLTLQTATDSAVRASIPLYSPLAENIGHGQQVVMQATLDVNKMKIIAKSEEAEKNLEIEIHEETWPLDLYTYGGNMLSAIGGGHSGGSGISKPNKTQSTLGGAMAGASAGSVAGPYGAVIGAVVGGVAGYMSAG